MNMRSELTNIQKTTVDLKNQVSKLLNVIQ